MTALDLVNSLVDAHSREDTDGLNKLFQLQTLVAGLQEDLAFQQNRASEAESRTSALEGKLQQLQSELTACHVIQ